MASSNNGTGGTTTAQQQQQQQAAGQEEASPPPWWAAFPEPKASCHRLEAADVMQLLESHASLGTHSDRSFLLVDVRRTDWEGGTVATSINLPAQTLYQTRPVIYQLCKQAGVKTIIFYCGKSTRPSFTTTKPQSLVRAGQRNAKASSRLTCPCAAHKKGARAAEDPVARAGCKTTSTRWARRASRPPFSRAASRGGRRRTAGG